jgi:hypothetical protein
MSPGRAPTTGSLRVRQREARHFTVFGDDTIGEVGAKTRDESAGSDLHHASATSQGTARATTRFDGLTGKLAFLS